MRRCLDCPALIPTGTRCTQHRRAHDRARRPPPHERGYDADYQSARAEILARHPDCELRLDGCTTTATTIDHQPALSSMPAGRWHGRLVPACSWCNTSKGAR